MRLGRYPRLPIIVATSLFAMVPLDITVPALNLSLMALAKVLLPSAVDWSLYIKSRMQNAQWLKVDLAHPVE